MGQHLYVPVAPRAELQLSVDIGGYLSASVFVAPCRDRTRQVMAAHASQVVDRTASVRLVATHGEETLWIGTSAVAIPGAVDLVTAFLDRHGITYRLMEPKAVAA